MKRFLLFVLVLGVALSAWAAGAPRPVVVGIADYLQTNGVVSARRNLTEAVLKAGFIPVVLPEMDKARASELLSRCDALVLGGSVPEQDSARRHAFEDIVLTMAAERRMPIVGICFGAQAINRHFGGTVGKVPAGGSIVHKNAAHPAGGRRVEHEVTVPPGDSLMARVFGAGAVRVNSSHNYCCRRMAEGLKVTATSSDGVVEAYEDAARSIYGFQFHPEAYWQKDERCLELLRLSLRPAREGK